MSRVSNDSTDNAMSTIGFAASPGTDVEPTCSIFRSCEPNAARI